MINRIDLTLREQLRISDIEILYRKELLDLTLEDFKHLTNCKLFISEHIDSITTEFYEKQTQVDEISLLIGDADTLRRLRAALHQYILDLFAGYYDSDYVNNRLRIGIVHKRIGVEPKLYLSAVRTLKKILEKNLTHFIRDTIALEHTLDALDKLLYFDTTLVFDTYIDSLVGELDTAKKRTELYAKSLELKVIERTKQLEELAQIDSLTNIYNQRAMYDYLRRELALAKRNTTKLSIIYFDVDKFKQINDNEGHLKGDEVLRKIGQILKHTLREVDIPCRYGGDEFCIILPSCDIECATIVSQKIIQEFSEKYSLYTISIGIAETGTATYMDSEKLIKIADKKMYLAKQKNGFQICS